MKRKRPAKDDQCLKEQENLSSTKSLRSSISGKLQTLLNGFVSELQSISEDKRQDVALLFSSKYEETNSTEVPETVKCSFPSLANSSDSSKVLQNFIDSAKSRISGLLNNKPTKSKISGLLNNKPTKSKITRLLNNEPEGEVENYSLKTLRSSSQQTKETYKTKNLTIDPLEIKINLKFQSLLVKALDTKKANHVNSRQSVVKSESVITEKDLQDFSRMLQDFSQSAKQKLQATLAKEQITHLQNSSVGIQNSTVKESSSSDNIRPSLVSQRKSRNQDLQTTLDSPGNSSHSVANDSLKLTKKNPKLSKMDFSSDSSSSPRNPFDEGCMLLLSDAEKCPKYVELHLSSDSDLDESEDVAESAVSPAQQSESEDEVIVLGEKSKTYQEVTLEEDDDGEVHEKVVEKVVEKCPVKEEKQIEDPMFNCPKCDKSFRIQSLLQFHIKMHATEIPSSNASENHCTNSSSSSEDGSSSERPRSFHQRIRKEKENTKVNSKMASMKKSRREKYKRRSKVTSKGPT